MNGEKTLFATIFLGVALIIVGAGIYYWIGSSRPAAPPVIIPDDYLVRRESTIEDRVSEKYPGSEPEAAKIGRDIKIRYQTESMDDRQALDAEIIDIQLITAFFYDPKLYDTVTVQAREKGGERMFEDSKAQAELLAPAD